MVYSAGQRCPVFYFFEKSSKRCAKGVDDEAIKNRVTEIIKRDIEDFVERWVKPRKAE